MKKLLALIFLLLTLFISFYLLGLFDNSVVTNAPPVTQTSAQSFTQPSRQERGVTTINKNTPENPLAPNDNPEQFETGLVAKLRSKYLAHINNLAVQASLFEIKKQLISMDPEHGTSIFKHAIIQAFPEQADSILKIMFGMETYQDWLIANQSKLNEMSPLVKNGSLWDQRHKIFGEDADIIWAHEREALMKKQVKIQDIIHRLDNANDIDLNEKLYQLRISIDETYSGTVEGLTSNSSVVSQIFFGLNSVQSELKSLSEEDRQNTLNDVRRQLGYSEEQIAIQQKHDEDHSARWKSGNNYMAEFNALTSSLDTSELSDPTLIGQLEALRLKYFKHEAETIKKEEASGFYRFNRPHIYGRN